jgi:hypothetical protein
MSTKASYVYVRKMVFGKNVYASFIIGTWTYRVSGFILCNRRLLDSVCVKL